MQRVTGEGGVFLIQRSGHLSSSKVLNFKPIIRPFHPLPTNTVADLLHPNSRNWNQPLLQTLFLPFEVDAINKICLSPQPTTDRLIWHYHHKGIYTVKSGYNLAQTLNAPNHNPSTSNPLIEAHLWKSIWNMNTYPKVRSFMWKLAHNIVSVGTNLQKRKCHWRGCNYCGSPRETERHLLFDCPLISQLWTLFPLGMKWKNLQVSNIKHLLQTIFANETPDDAAFFGFLCWNIWKNRCNLIFNQQSLQPNQILINTHAAMEEIKNLPSSATTVDRTSQPVKWIKPPVDTIKVNVDAAWVNGNTGLGLIGRNSAGSILFAGSIHKNSTCSPEHAELLAILEASFAIKSRGLRCVIVESDCLAAIHRLQSEEEDLSSLGTLADAIRKEFRDIPSVSFSWVGRNCNRAAHLLATFSLNSSFSRYWGSSPPTDVITASKADV